MTFIAPLMYGVSIQGAMYKRKDGVRNALSDLRSHAAVLLNSICVLRVTLRCVGFFTI